MSWHTDLGSISLKQMTAPDLEDVLRWRNDARVRHMMLKPDIIQWEDHRKWFETSSRMPNRHLFVASEGGRRFGFMQLHTTESSAVADWGFHISPDAARGLGAAMCAATLDLAFSALDVHKVSGQVLAFNTKSLALHQRLGFAQEGLLRAHHRVGEQWHDLICFGILKTEWAARKEGTSK
jgi:UDP-4-amino-4,6-dideoxy-N-acetyl-beta-L-altrosamine N-acetyltransferase